MSNLLNKVKEALSGDNTHETTTHTTETHSTSTNAGPHSSNIANKVDPRVDSDLDGSRNMGARRQDNFGATTAGPHNSNVANKLDPRVDSDLDGSHNMGARGVGTTDPRGGAYGSTHTAGGSNVATKLDPRTGTTGGTAYGHSNVGPHSSNAANKLDPRIDSDLDHRGTTGTYSGGSYGAGHTTAAAGLHSSNLANKADPRVDSDRDHRAAGTTGAFGSSHTAGAGTGVGHTGTAGTSSAFHPTSTGAVGGAGGTTLNSASTATGPHRSAAANKVDPKVDSDRDHRGSHAASATGPGKLLFSTRNFILLTVCQSPAPNTAGPHKSDMLNKLDPRVDSDLDGSKTYGGDKTHTGTQY
jgi:hypothetical protein